MTETTHIIALKTYGTHVKSHQGKRVSALKIGYTNAVPLVLLALLPTAENISSKRDSYIYIYLPNKPKLHQHWLFVEVNDNELARVEQITMSQRSSQDIALWRDSQWQLLPCTENPVYHDTKSRYATPTGSPHGYWAIDTSGNKSATGGSGDPDALIAEYSKLDPNKPAWWWIPGNDATYQHRQTLKSAGCRWRRNRKAYSYVGDKLPESILTLLTNAEECRAIMAGTNPEEAKQMYRHRNSATTNAATDATSAIERLIDTVLRNNIQSICQSAPYPLLITRDNLQIGQDVVGLDPSNQQRIWTISGPVSAQQLQLIHATNAEFSQQTRRWLFQDKQQIAALDEFLALCTQDDLTEPCTLDEAAAVLGMAVHRNEPTSAYARGKTAWTTRTLVAGIENRPESIPHGTRYTIQDIDFTIDPRNPVYIVALQDGQIVRIREEELLPERLFTIGQTVYVRHESETAQGVTIPTGHRGTITKLYRFNPNLGSLRGHTYDVDWQDIGIEWMFEDELTSEPTILGIMVTRHRMTNFGTDDQSLSAERQAIVQRGDKSEALEDPPTQLWDCPCEALDGPKGWLPAEHLGTWIACGTCNPNGNQLPMADMDNPQETLPAIRIIQASKITEDASTDDAITSAIRYVSTLSPTPNKLATTPPSAKQIFNIPQDYVGELTGSVVAGVYCYGYATNAGELIYLNMGGPRSGVEAIRAQLAQGKAVNLIPDDGPAIELTAGEGNTGVYKAFINNLSDVRFVSMILAHEDWLQPNYHGKATTYLMQVTEAQAKGQVLHHIRELVPVPIFPDWTDYLWQAGQNAMLIRNCTTGGGITFKLVDLDITSWKRIITGGVANKIIAIPQASH